jgi:hypothetical protein
MVDFFYQSKQNWLRSLQHASFRKSLIPACILVAGILSSMPFFFQTIEKRDGTMLHDWVLDQIPPHNLSVAIFIVIWSTALLALIRAIKDPEIFILFAWSYVFVSLMRALTITFIPLLPPLRLVVLTDPLSNTFYGNVTITKDLFFSGHTSTIFLIFLCLKKKSDRIFTLTAVFLLAIFLLIQHIHYVIDVVAAPLFTYISFLMGKRASFGKPDKNKIVKE